MQQIFERIFVCLYAGYGIHIKSWEIIILFSMCRYAQSCAFISVIELPRIPAYCPKSLYQIPENITSTGAISTFSLTEFSELSRFFIFLQNFIFYKKTLAFFKNICYTFRAVTNKQFHHSKTMRGSAW